MKRSRSHNVSYDHVQGTWGNELEHRINESVAFTGLLGQMCHYHLDCGGKRVRAILPVWVCMNLNGSADDALDVGAGFELLHNASLVHDDLQDGDCYRRGKPAVWYRWGGAQAITVGDSLIFQSIGRLLRAPDALAVVMIAYRALELVTEGQIMEFQFKLPAGHSDALYPTLARWEEMARKKTGQLLSACLQAGAVAAHADANTIKSIGEYGELLGLLFQVQDDYLDIVGEKGRDSRGSDLMEGKISFLVAWVLEHGDASAVAALRRVIECDRAEKTREMIEESIALLERVGALRATAAWLNTARIAALHHPMAEVVPGLVARILSPVSHALPQDDALPLSATR